MDGMPKQLTFCDLTTVFLTCQNHFLTKVCSPNCHPRSWGRVRKNGENRVFRLFLSLTTVIQHPTLRSFLSVWNALRSFETAKARHPVHRGCGEIEPSVLQKSAKNDDFSGSARNANWWSTGPGIHNSRKSTSDSCSPHQSASRNVESDCESVLHWFRAIRL
jgi:hypothetical protein